MGRDNCGSVPHSETWIATLLMGSTPTRSWYIQTVNVSHPHFRSLPSLQLHWYDSLYSEATVNPTLLLGFLPLGGPDHHCANGFYPHSKSTHPICRFVTPPLQNPTKFAGIIDGITPTRRQHRRLAKILQTIQPYRRYRLNTLKRYDHLCIIQTQTMFIPIT